MFNISTGSGLVVSDDLDGRVLEYTETALASRRIKMIKNLQLKKTSRNFEHLRCVDEL